MSISDFCTILGLVIAVFTAGCSLGCFVGYHLGRFDRREEDRKHKNNRPDSQS
jgi:membrane protein YqaA with SNARE-associated domain